MATAEKKKFTFDPKKAKRNRCVGWDPKENKGVYSNSMTNDDGSIRVEKAKLLGIDPATVKPITIADLHNRYGQSAKEALAQFVKDNDYATPDDAVWDLIVASAMQNAANASVAEHRPVTDKAVERASFTLRAVLKAQGKSDAEIDQLLSAFGK